jgi:PAS domain S-box-containing protein
MWMAWGPELTFFCNDAYAPTLGIKQSWALGSRSDKVWEEIWPDIGPRIERVFTSNEATWDEDLLLFLERSGYPEETYHTFSYSPLADDDGAVRGMLCVVTEETNRVLAERRVATLRELGAQTARARSAEDACQIAMQVLEQNREDFPYAIVRLIDAECKQARFVAGCGLSADHPLLSALLPLDNDPRVASTLERDEIATVALRSEETALLPSGPWSSAPTEAVIAPMLSKTDSGISGYMAAGINPHRRFDSAYRDFIGLVAAQIASAIANANAHEEERKRIAKLAEIDRAKTAFFSNVSHEFRTPLTLMLGPLEDALREGDDQRLAMVHRNGLRLMRLVNTLLDFSRAEAGRATANFEPTDLGAFTEELASNFRSAFDKAGLYLDVDTQTLYGTSVAVDRSMWEKIVLNLLSNAFKFTLAGGVKLSLAKVDNEIELAVADTGVGIPKEHQSRVFDRFHRIENQQGRTHEGTGIGLALVSDLTTLHGGTVNVTSREGQGTTFTVRIPARTGPKSESKHVSTAPSARPFVEEALRWLPGETVCRAPTVNSERPDRARARIVLADDNADMRAYIARLLDEAGYDVVVVEDGEAALAAIQSTSPALVLSDVMMPRLDGLGLARALRANSSTATIPIVLLSARSGEDAQVQGLGAGADDYITKPFVARELIARVQTTITHSQLRADMLKRAETAAMRLRLVADAVPALVAYVDREERYRFTNRAFMEWFGQDVTGQTLRDVLGEAAYAVISPYVQSVLSGGRVKYEAEIPYKNGGARRVDATYLPDVDTAGMTRGFYVFVYDLTDRLRRDAALSESEARFREMADNSPVMVWVTEADGRCTYLSRRWYEFTGQTEADGLGFGWLSATHPDDKILSEQKFNEATALYAPFSLEYRLRRADGTYRWCIDAASPRIGAMGEFLGYVGSVIDITDRKANEQALRTAHDTFRHLVDRSPFGIYVVDSDFRLVQVSQGAQKVFVNVRPILGRDFAEVLRSLWPEPFATEAIGRFRHTLATGEAYHSTATVERRSDIDAVEAYDWKVERITLPDGRPGAVCHFYDLTERHAYHAKIETLMREVNHRAKNMLALVDVVAKQTAASSSEDFVERFSSRVRALAASQDLLVQTEWEGADLFALIESQFLHFKDLIGERIILHGPSVYVAPRAAQTVGMAMHELATNSAKYGALSNETGSVEISWKLVQEKEERGFAMSWIERGGPRVVPPTRRGFGQRVAKTIVESELAGQVKLDYLESGLEWTLCCSLAAIGFAVASPTPPQAAPAPSVAVLVVEDDALLALYLADSLEAAGYEIVGPAASVAHALKLLGQRDLCLAILDINLGAETSEPVAQSLQEREVPFISISGFSRSQQPPIFQNSPFLSKPVHLPSLLQEIERVKSTVRRASKSHLSEILPAS